MSNNVKVSKHNSSLKFLQRMFHKISVDIGLEDNYYNGKSSIYPNWSFIKWKQDIIKQLDKITNL